MLTHARRHRAQANKRQIKQAVKELYDIQPQKVNTLIRCVDA